MIYIVINYTSARYDMTYNKLSCIESVEHDKMGKIAEDITVTSSW